VVLVELVESAVLVASAELEGLVESAVLVGLAVPADLVVLVVWEGSVARVSRAVLVVSEELAESAESVVPVSRAAWVVSGAVVPVLVVPSAPVVQSGVTTRRIAEGRRTEIARLQISLAGTHAVTHSQVDREMHKGRTASEPAILVEPVPRPGRTHQGAGL
jgi:hypothetical protein